MPTLPPIKVATTGLVCVVEAINAEMTPREKMPLMPTLSPPPALILPPTTRLSLISTVLAEILPMFADGASMPLMSTTASPAVLFATYAYLPTTVMPLGTPDGSVSMPAPRGATGLEMSITLTNPAWSAAYA